MSNATSDKDFRFLEGGERLHFHPEHNIVNGIDVTKVVPMRERNHRFAGLVIQNRLKKQAENVQALDISKRVRSDSVSSEGEASSPISASPSSLSSSLPTSGAFSSAFMVRPLSGDKAIKHEFDFVNK